MSELKGGVAAYTNSWKTDVFGTNEKKIDLQISHEFWSHTVTQSDKNGWIVSKIRLKNTGSIALKNVKIYVDIDDESAMFDAHICDHNGNIIDANGTPVLDFEDIAPGCESVKESYWWIVKPAFPDVTGEEQTEVKLNLYPMFTADFKQSNQVFTSTSRLEKS